MEGLSGRVALPGLSVLNRPWLHFLLLGLLLFQLQRLVFPEPKPVLGPLSESRIESLRQQWLALAGRLPSERELAESIRRELDRDMLFQRALDLELHLHDPVVYQRLLRNMAFLQLAVDASDQQRYEQALALRLHLGDEVIKRRLVQVMEQLLLAANPPAPVTEAAIAAEFARRQEELRQPRRYSIEHLYFRREQEAEVPQVIARIQDQGMRPREARELGSPFLPGYEFRGQTPDQLARNFGAVFAMELEAAEPEPGTWVGPIRSSYGLHYVWVDMVEPPRDATLDEVRRQLERDLESRYRKQALERAVERMREGYEVRV
jgi:hypothetical protein